MAACLLCFADGWVSKFDIYNLRYIAEIRAGINTATGGVRRRPLRDVGNYLPHTLVVLDARDLSPLKVIAVKDDEGGAHGYRRCTTPVRARASSLRSRISPSVGDPVERRPRADLSRLRARLPHGEALAAEGPFPVRRIKLDDYLDDFFFDPPYNHLIGARATATAARCEPAGRPQDR